MFIKSLRMFSAELGNSRSKSGCKYGSWSRSYSFAVLNLPQAPVEVKGNIIDENIK